MTKSISLELERCLNCVNKPCQLGCPLHNDIPKIIGLLKNNQLKESAEVLLTQSPLGSICGRICPKSKQCQGKCTRKYKDNPIQIGLIERYLGDLILQNDWRLPSQEEKNKTIAIIGGGPAGLTCTYFLKLNGYKVTIFEKNNKLGGLLTFGIPDFRLNKDIVAKNIEYITKGIEVQTNKILGEDFLLDDLIEKYDAIVIATGTHFPINLNIPGENIKGVFNGNALLENNSHPIYTNKSVAIIGGGNVALDAARTIKKLNVKDVIIIYRRPEINMPAELEEIRLAKEEGVKFLFETNITRINGSTKVENIECIKTTINKANNKVENIPNTAFTLPIDYVIKCLGTKNDLHLPNVLLNDSNQFLTNEQHQTNIAKVFACGDVTENIKTVANAAFSGRKTAENIIKYLYGE